MNESQTINRKKYSLGIFSYTNQKIIDLSAPNISISGQTFDVKLKTNINNYQELSFKIPLYIQDEEGNLMPNFRIEETDVEHLEELEEEVTIIDDSKEELEQIDTEPSDDDKNKDANLVEEKEEVETDIVDDDLQNPDSPLPSNKPKQSAETKPSNSEDNQKIEEQIEEVFPGDDEFVPKKPQSEESREEREDIHVE